MSDTLALPRIAFHTRRTHRAVAGLSPPIISPVDQQWPLLSPNCLSRTDWCHQNVSLFLRPASAGSPSCVSVAATVVGVAVVVVKVIVEYPGVRWWGNVMVAVSTVTAALARKLHVAFACKGSYYGGGGSGIIAGQDSCSATTALSIGAPWSKWMELLPQADIPSAR